MKEINIKENSLKVIKWFNDKHREKGNFFFFLRKGKLWNAYFMTFSVSVLGKEKER